MHLHLNVLYEIEKEGDGILLEFNKECTVSRFNILRHALREIIRQKMLLMSSRGISWYYCYIRSH